MLYPYQILLGGRQCLRLPACTRCLLFLLAHACYHLLLQLCQQRSNQLFSLIFNPTVLAAAVCATVCRRYVILHATCTLVTFGSMFCSVTQLPVLLAQPPYGPTGHGLSPGMIGLACLSASAAGIVAAPIGGRIADFSAAVHGQNAHPLQRLLYNNALNLVLKPIGLLLYGWTAQYKLHLALPLIGMFLIGVSNNVYLPGIFSYVTNYKPQAAAAAAAGIHSVMCVSSGVLTMFGAVAVQALGSGAMFSILAALNVAVSLAAAVQICACSGVSNWQQLREFSSSSFKMSKELHLHMPEASEGSATADPAALNAQPARDGCAKGSKGGAQQSSALAVADSV